MKHRHWKCAVGCKAAVKIARDPIALRLCAGIFSIRYSHPACQSIPSRNRLLSIIKNPYRMLTAKSRESEWYMNVVDR